MEYTKVIHRWWGGAEMPEQYRKYGEKWQKLNPDWIVMEWDETIFAQLNFGVLGSVINHLYERDGNKFGIELYVQLADVIGYELVRQFGGVYVNCDMEPLLSLDGRLPQKAWASYENHEDWRVVNAAIGAPSRNDPFWSGLVHSLPDRYFSRPFDEMVMSTGPGYLTDYYDIHREELFVFPKHTFNPVHWKDIPAGGDASGFVFHPESIAAHHWGHKKDRRSNFIETATQR